MKKWHRCVVELRLVLLSRDGPSSSNCCCFGREFLEGTLEDGDNNGNGYPIVDVQLALACVVSLLP